MSRYGYGVTDTVIMRLIEEVVRARGPEKINLIAKIGTDPLSSDERENLRLILSDELVETGLGLDDQPNERGLLVEAAIDWLGHK